MNRIYDVKPVLTTTVENVHVSILPVGASHWVVQWGDRAEDVRQESYTTRALAFARLALLVEAADDMWLPTFADDADGFAARWAGFASFALV